MPWRTEQIQKTIVPNSKWVDELTVREIGQSSGRCLLGQKFFTLKEYVTSLHPEAYPIIGSSLKKHLIKEIFRSKNDLTYFKRPTSGTISAICNAISKLKKNGISPGRLKDLMEQRIVGKNRSKIKETDLHSIYDSYEKELSERCWHDEEGLVSLLTGNKEPLRIYGFHKIEPWMKNISANAIFEEAKASEKQKTELLSFNSPTAEAKYIREEISKLISEGKDPTTLAVVLKNGSRFAWKITDEAPFGLLSSRFLTFICNSPLPEQTTLEEYISKSKKIIEKEFLRLNPDETDSLGSRLIAQADALLKIFERLSFEFHVFGKNKLSKNDFFEILDVEAASFESWPSKLFFKLIPFEDAGLYNIEKTFIPQMNEGIIPSANSGIRFFSYADPLNESDILGQIFPKYEEEIQLELELFKKSFSGETVVSYSNFDISGKESAASPFLSSHSEKSKPVILRSHLKESAAQDKCGKDFTGKKELELLKIQLGEKGFSPTKLEVYAECPFAFFCRYILNIEPLEEETPDIQAKDIGTIVHEMLEIFFRDNQKKFKELIKDKDKSYNFDSEIEQLADTVFGSDKAKEIFTSRANDREMVEHFKKRAIFYLKKIVSEELEFLRSIPQKPAPSYFEEKFDGTIEGIRFTGKIDRIDIDDSERLTVIDYKTGSPTSVINGIAEGTELQIPLYVTFAEILLKKEAVAGFLYSVKKFKRSTGIAVKEHNAESIGIKGSSKLLVENEKFRELIDKGIEWACKYAKEIGLGKFASDPEKCGQFCDWKDVCRKR